MYMNNMYILYCISIVFLAYNFLVLHMYTVYVRIHAHIHSMYTVQCKTSVMFA